MFGNIILYWIEQTTFTIFTRGYKICPSQRQIDHIIETDYYRFMAVGNSTIYIDVEIKEQFAITSKLFITTLLYFSILSDE